MISYLFSLGMALTLLGVTGLMQHGVLAAFVLLGVNGLAALGSLHRRIALGGGCVLTFAGVLWMLMSGMGLLGEVFQALLLHMSGLMTALPMVGVPFTVIICVLCVAASWFVTQRSAGAYPALILLVMAAVLLWLGDWPDVLICLLPSAVACVTLLLRAGDEQIRTLQVLPLAVAVTLIAFTGVAMGGLVSEPMKELADTIRQRIYDTFFYTQPRDVFTLATEGYYPQGLGQLGGPAEPREEPVMAVITPRKAYLRGVIKNIYTGRTWLDDVGGRRYLFSASRFEELRTATFDQALPLLDGTADASLPSARMLQVRMLRDSASTMFAPQRIRSLSPEGELIPYFNTSSEIFATSNLKLGDVWTMEAALFTANDPETEALVNAACTVEDTGWESVCDRYLQLHEDIDQRVYDLAAQVTAGKQTDFAKARALQQHLAANYTYSLDVPEQPANQDFVSTFIVEGKAGYCTYFASAMTVMCRMAGLPARYVEGYVAYPDGEGLAVVTGKEGHAWTEVYFRGFGWVTFDATPTSAEYIDDSGELPDTSGEEASPTPQPSEPPAPSVPPEESPTPTPEPQLPPESEPSPQPSEQPGIQDADMPVAERTSLLEWLLLAVMILLVLRVYSVQPALQAKRQKTEFGRWMIWIQAVHDVLRRHGLHRERAETPSAFFRRVEMSGLANAALRSLAEAENLMFYGHADPLAEETAQARRCFQSLYRSLNGRQKLLFQLQRACMPRKRYDITAR